MDNTSRRFGCLHCAVLGTQAIFLLHYRFGNAQFISIQTHRPLFEIQMEFGVHGFPEVSWLAAERVPGTVPNKKASYSYSLLCFGTIFCEVIAAICQAKSFEKCH